MTAALATTGSESSVVVTDRSALPLTVVDSDAELSSELSSGNEPVTTALLVMDPRVDGSTVATTMTVTVASLSIPPNAQVTLPPVSEHDP